MWNHRRDEQISKTETASLTLTIMEQGGESQQGEKVPEIKCKLLESSHTKLTVIKIWGQWLYKASYIHILMSKYIYVSCVCVCVWDLLSVEQSYDRSQQCLYDGRLVETLCSTLCPLTHRPQHLHHQTAGPQGVCIHKQGHTHTHTHVSSFNNISIFYPW